MTQTICDLVAQDYNARKCRRADGDAQGNRGAQQQCARVQGQMLEKVPQFCGDKRTVDASGWNGDRDAEDRS